MTQTKRRKAKTPKAIIRVSKNKIIFKGNIKILPEILRIAFVMKEELT